jgi:hypothetical protein
MEALYWSLVVSIDGALLEQALHSTADYQAMKHDIALHVGRHIHTRSP